MKTVFFDIDTQLDFVFPAGALYVPGAEQIIPVVSKLNRYAVHNSLPLISTMDAHAENDPEFRHWPPHCIVGTIGQTKPKSTLVGTPVVIPAREAKVSRLDVQQIILEKVTTNCFDHPKLEALLRMLDADRYVVYGVVTEVCVKFAAMGLLKTGKKVEVVSDAISHLSEPARDAMLAEFERAGGVVRTS